MGDTFPKRSQGGVHIVSSHRVWPGLLLADRSPQADYVRYGNAKQIMRHVQGMTRYRCGMRCRIVSCRSSLPPPPLLIPLLTSHR